MNNRKKVLILLASVLSLSLAYAVPATFISPDQITVAPFSITAPGRYILTDDVAFARSGGTAITINASDVTLDLNGKSIVNSGIGVEHGISLATTLTNITIKNGALRIFDGNGISIPAGSSDLVFEDIAIIGRAMPGASTEVGIGFNFAGTSGAATRTANVTIQNTAVSNCLRGILATATDGVKITNSSFNYSTMGMLCTDCNGWDLFKSQASFNVSTGQAVGLNMRSCNNWTLKWSHFSGNNSPTNPTSVIFSIIAGPGMSGGHTIENCEFNNNLCTGATNLDALNFSSTHSSIIRNCTFNGNGSVSGSTNGMIITGSAIIIEDCTANGNFGPTTARGCILSGTGHVVRNCTFSENFSSAAGAQGIITNNCVGVSIENCVALGNMGAGGAGIGIFTQNTVKSMVKNCTAIGNAGNSGANSRGFQGGTNAGDVLFIGNVAFGQATNYFSTQIPFLTIPATGPYPVGPTFDERGLANLSFV